MKKKLVEVSNLDSYICLTKGRIYVDNCMILTPGAKDELNKRKISIIRDSKPDYTSCGADTCPSRVCRTDTTGTRGIADACDTDMERLFYGVAAMVKEEYGIDDPQQLKDISCQIVDTLKKNI